MTVSPNKSPKKSPVKTFQRSNIQFAAKANSKVLAETVPHNNQKDEPNLMDDLNSDGGDFNNRDPFDNIEVGQFEQKRFSRPESGRQRSSSRNKSTRGSQDKENEAGITNMQDQFFEIMNDEQVEDVIDLNEKFLANALGGIEVTELSSLNKLELRVDTTCHSLQVTGEILPSLEYLKLNDSIIGSFRDIGTSFKNVRVLHIARCELKEVQGIQAFEQLEELYISYNAIEDLFDISFCEHLQILDFEGNNVVSIDNLYYLKRLTKLNDLNLKHNGVTKEFSYYNKIKENAPNLQVLDDEDVGENPE